MEAGDCVLLAHGAGFCLATDLTAARVEFDPRSAVTPAGRPLLRDAPSGGAILLGGHFLLSGKQSGVLLRSLPPVVHIRKRASKRFCVGRLSAFATS